MTNLTASLCILCHDRPDELERAIASARDFDEIVVCDMASEPPIPPIADTVWFRSEANQGVAAGRNTIAARASGELLVFLDDDAVFATPEPAAAVRAAFDTHDRPTALAFLVVRPSGSVESSEFPFRGSPREMPHVPCGYFVGCGFAVRHADYDRAGGFDERYVYSTEELDLAFALQRDGGIIMYEPRVAVVHAPSARGRAPRPTIPALRLRNRLLLVRRHLPWPVALVHGSAWAVRTLQEAIAERGLTEWLRAGREGFGLPVERKSSVVRRLRKIHARGGRVWW